MAILRPTPNAGRHGAVPWIDDDLGWRLPVQKGDWMVSNLELAGLHASRKVTVRLSQCEGPWVAQAAMRARDLRTRACVTL